MPSDEPQPWRGVEEEADALFGWTALGKGEIMVALRRAVAHGVRLAEGAHHTESLAVLARAIERGEVEV